MSLLKNRIKYHKIFRSKKFWYLLFCFMIAFGITISIDVITKFVFFDKNVEKQNIGVSHGLIGIRSFAHYNTTFFSNIGWDIGNGLLITMSVFILILLAGIAVYYRHPFALVAIGISFGGVLGNTLDRMISGYVLDIIYLPWRDRGTFNFADLFIVVGSVLFIMFVIYDLFWGSKKRKAKGI